MGETAPNTKSTTDQIIEKLFDALRKSDDFDEVILEQLQELADKGMLVNQNQVERALKSIRG